MRGRCIEAKKGVEKVGPTARETLTVIGYVWYERQDVRLGLHAVPYSEFEELRG